MQCYGIPLSFLSLALTSVKLFYSQRLGRFPDVDPSLQMIAFVFIFILLQITGPLFSLVLLASYFKGYVILFVVFVIAANFIVLNFIFDKGNQETLRKLYEYERNLSPAREKEKLMQDSKTTLITAILTSWVTTCTVWSNNFINKSYFLLLSSFTSTVAFMICLSCIYIYTAFEEISSKSLAPITHCFLKLENDLQIGKVNFCNKSVLNLLNICGANEYCLPNQRLCSELERPADVFYNFVGPIGFLLLLISLISSLCLQLLGNYNTMYSWSRKICFFCPIIHISLLQDGILNNKIEFIQSFDDIIKANPNIINQTDPLHGDSLMISAAKAKSLNLMKKMILLNGNIDTVNIYGHTVEHFLKVEVKVPEDQQERSRILDLIELRKTTNGDNENVKCRVWREQPMHKAVRINKIRFLCFLHILGGQWGAINIENKDILEHLIFAINNGDFEVTRCNTFVRWCLKTATDHFGQSLLCIASRDGKARCLNELLKTNINVNVRRKVDGYLPLHDAARHGHFDCLRILIENGANVNAKSFLGFTPLHRATLHGFQECAQLLINNGADVHTPSNFNQTPLHFAALQGQYDIMKLLIEKGANVNFKDNMDCTALHFAYGNGKIDCLQLLLDSGADKDINVQNKLMKTPLTRC